MVFIHIPSNSVIVNNAVYDVVIEDQIKLSVNGQEVDLKVEGGGIDPVNSVPESMIPYFCTNDFVYDQHYDQRMQKRFLYLPQYRIHFE